MLHGRLLSLKQDKDYLHYKVTWPETASPPISPSSNKGGLDTVISDDTEDLLKHYFSLKYDLTSLYDQWSESDPNFGKKAPKFTGIRILSQDAWEALISFICSSNNNISRISQMVLINILDDYFSPANIPQVLKLCKYYGPPIGQIGDEAFHDFPGPQALVGEKVEAHLRELGFGYRARYIVETARLVSEDKPEGWLESLANPGNPGWLQAKPSSDDAQVSTYKYAHEQLLLLSGVGPKVADCVCLMGLGWGEAVPVDTHMWQIAQRDYNFGKAKAKTFSRAMYDSVGDHFRNIWGPQAGWAHSVLFTANLKSFSEQAAAKIEDADVKVKVEEEQIASKALPRSRKRQISVVETVKIEQQVAEGPVRNLRKRKIRE